MSRIERQKLETFIRDAHQERQLVRARITSPAEYEPFELCTYTGYVPQPGEAPEIRNKFTYFRTRRRVVLPFQEFVTEEERPELLTFTKDSRLEAHFVTLDETLCLRILDTQRQDQICCVQLAGKGLSVGNAPLDKKRALLKFSNDGKRLAIIFAQEGKPNTELYLLNINTKRIGNLASAIPNQNIVSMTWTPDGSGLLFIDRRKAMDTVFFFSGEATGIAHVKSSLQPIRHVEFLPSGNEILFFMGTGLGKNRHLQPNMVRNQWPLTSGTAIQMSLCRTNFVSAPDRAWSADGRMMVFNSIADSKPKLCMYDTLANTFVACAQAELCTAVIHDYHDEEMLIEHPTPNGSRRLYLITTELDAEPGKDITDTFKLVDEFRLCTGSVPFTTHMLFHPEEDEFKKSAGFLMFPAAKSAGDSGKYPLIVIPHSGIGSYSVAVSPSIAVRLMLKAGFAVLHVNYRLPTETGFSTCRSLPEERDCGDSKDISDTLNQLLKSELAERVESENMYLFAQHYGAFVGARLLTTSDCFQAAAFVEPLLHFFCTCSAHSKPDIAKAKDHEPHVTAGKVKAPLLVISDKDKAEIPNLNEFLNKMKNKKTPRQFKQMGLQYETYVIDALEWFTTYRNNKSKK